MVYVMYSFFLILGVDLDFRIVFSIFLLYFLDVFHSIFLTWVAFGSSATIELKLMDHFVESLDCSEYIFVVFRCYCHGSRVLYSVSIRIFLKPLNISVEFDISVVIFLLWFLFITFYFIFYLTHCLLILIGFFPFFFLIYSLFYSILCYLSWLSWLLA